MDKGQATPLAVASVTDDEAEVLAAKIRPAWDVSAVDEPAPSDTILESVRIGLGLPPADGKATPSDAASLDLVSVPAPPAAPRMQQRVAAAAERLSPDGTFRLPSQPPAAPEIPADRTNLAAPRAPKFEGDVDGIATEDAPDSSRFPESFRFAEPTGAFDRVSDDDAPRRPPPDPARQKRIRTFAFGVLGACGAVAVLGGISAAVRASSTESPSSISNSAPTATVGPLVPAATVQGTGPASVGAGAEPATPPASAPVVTTATVAPTPAIAPTTPVSAASEKSATAPARTSEPATVSVTHATVPVPVPVHTTPTVQHPPATQPHAATPAAGTKPSGKPSGHSTTGIDRNSPF